MKAKGEADCGVQMIENAASSIINSADSFRWSSGFSQTYIKLFINRCETNSKIEMTRQFRPEKLRMGRSTKVDDVKR